MKDKAPTSQREIDARRQLAELCLAILAGTVPYLEGAVQIIHLRSEVGGVSERDPDFDCFTAISSETDDLPLAAQRHLWSASALERLKPKQQKAEAWAQSFGVKACQSLVQRFHGG